MTAPAPALDHGKRDRAGHTGWRNINAGFLIARGLNNLLKVLPLLIAACAAQRPFYGVFARIQLLGDFTYCATLLADSGGW